MDILRLSPQQQQILGTLELQAATPIGTLATKLRLREHTLRYQLDNFVSQGLLRKRAFINVYPLGLQDHAIYFSLSASSEAAKQKFVEYLRKSEKVSWLSQLGGDYQYGFSVCASRLSDVVAFLDDLSNKFPDLFFDKALSIRVSLAYFGRKYLGKRPEPMQSFKFGDGVSRIAIDELDHRILCDLESEPIRSDRELARRLDIPHSTAASRLRNLAKAGVLGGYVYDIDASRFGMQRFNLLVFSKGFDAAFAKQLRDFAAAHPQVIHFVRCLGSWDFELGVEVVNGQAVSPILEELYRRFGSKLNTVKILPHFGNLKLRNYPFLSFKSLAQN